MEKSTNIGRGIILGALFTAVFIQVIPAAAQRRHEGGEARPDGPSDATVERTLARELGRLNDRLELGAFPEGNGLWTSRVAAALEHRLRNARSPESFAPHLTARLAHDLRRLGVEHDLERPRSGPAAENAPAPPGPERAELLRNALASVRLLHGKLNRSDRASEPEVSLAPHAAPVNDDCIGAISLGDERVGGSTREATADGTASCGSSDGAPDVWYRYTAPGAGEVSFRVHDQDLYQKFDTVLSLHSGCPEDPDSEELACNDDSSSGVGSALTRTMESGEEVWIRVSGFEGDTGDFYLSVQRLGTISGTVTDEETGEIIEGASVTLLKDNRVEEQTSTASDGTYSFGPLAQDSYEIKASKSGLITELYDDVGCSAYNWCDPLHGSTRISVGGGEVSGIDFALEQAATISGTLTDAVDGQGIPGFVNLYGAHLGFLTSFQTEEDGSYTIDRLPAGKYYLQVSSQGYRREAYDDAPCPPFDSCTFASATALLLTAGETAAGVDFELDRLGVVTGRVIETGSGEPVSEERVWAFLLGDLYFESVTETNPDGTYRLNGLVDGTYWVWTDSAGHVNETYDDAVCDSSCPSSSGTAVDVSLNGTMTGIDFDLVAKGKLSGTVKEAVSGAALGSERIEIFSETGYDVESVLTDEEGAYEVLLSPGVFFVKTEVSVSSRYRDELYDDLPCFTYSCEPELGMPVEIQAGATTAGVDFVLDRWAVIQGRVDGGDGLTVGEGRAKAFDTTGSFVASGDIFGRTYTIRELDPGSYYVKVFIEEGSDPDDRYQDELFDDVPCEPSCNLSSGTPLSVGFNETISDIDFLLARCHANTSENVSGTEFRSSTKVEACERITAGSGTTVAPGADVTFQAGRSITLEDGFRVESGGKFRAVIEPIWAKH